MKNYRDRRAWLGLVLVTIVACAVGFAVVTRSGGEVAGLQGWDETALLERLGPPDHDVELSESDAGPEYRAKAMRRVGREPPVRVRELIWVGPFRITRVWVEQKAGEWVAFDAYEYGRWLQPKH